MKQGGIRGFGVTMILRRPADINKKALSQIGILTVLRMSHPRNIEAATKVDQERCHPGVGDGGGAALPSLPAGRGLRVLGFVLA